jgi:hypothetical protein
LKAALVGLAFDMDERPTFVGETKSRAVPVYGTKGHQIFDILQLLQLHIVKPGVAAGVAVVAEVQANLIFILCGKKE